MNKVEPNRSYRVKICTEKSISNYGPLPAEDVKLLLKGWKYYKDSELNKSARKYSCKEMYFERKGSPNFYCIKDNGPLLNRTDKLKLLKSIQPNQSVKENTGQIYKREERQWVIN